jgi:hypothetical protein
MDRLGRFRRYSCLNDSKLWLQYRIKAVSSVQDDYKRNETMAEYQWQKTVTCHEPKVQAGATTCTFFVVNLFVLEK